jgi:hypothetical protein
VIRGEVAEEVEDRLIVWILQQEGGTSVADVAALVVERLVELRRISASPGVDF